MGKKPHTRITDAALDAQIAKAKHAQRTLRSHGRVAESARYDPKSRRIDVTMTGGALFGIPVDRIRELKGASDDLLAKVSVDELGSGLRWDQLDVDVSVPGLIGEVFPAVIASAFAALGGRSMSEAKVAAARANGMKGGRPRIVRREDDDRPVTQRHVNKAKTHPYLEKPSASSKRRGKRS
jgi:hypothetical protein